MKKFRFLVFLFIVLFLTGCVGGKKVKTCVVESNQTKAGYTETTTYDIYAKGDKVTKVVQINSVKSDKKEIIDFYKKEYKNINKAYNDTYGGYSYNIDVKENVLTCDVTINYNKLDRKKYFKDYNGLKKYINKNNYFTVDGITKMYKNMGASCEETK